MVLDCKNVHHYATKMQGELHFKPNSNYAALTLTIPNISLEDEGDYVCEVQNRENSEKHCHKKYISVHGKNHCELASQTGRQVFMILKGTQKEEQRLQS